MLAMLDRLRDLESRKRREIVGTETFAQLAWEVVDVARLVQRWAEIQLRQANEALVDDTASMDVPLEDVPARRLDVVLAEWRQAEMVLSERLPGSPEAERAADDVARLRREYGILQERKIHRRRGLTFAGVRPRAARRRGPVSRGATGGATPRRRARARPTRPRTCRAVRRTPPRAQ